MKMTYSGVCVIGDLICMGCCGRDYTSRREVEKGILLNTKEFDAVGDRIKFRDRTDSRYLRYCGICKNLVYLDEKMDKVVCPLHPAFNKEDENVDLREGHCDVKYLCKAAELFNTWDKKKQDKFLRFIHKKKLDWYEFSMGMDGDSLILEFLKN